MDGSALSIRWPSCASPGHRSLILLLPLGFFDRALFIVLFFLFILRRAGAPASGEPVNDIAFGVNDTAAPIASTYSDECRPDP